MPVRSIETAGPAETESLGAQLAATLADGDVVLIQGELGAGKTTLVRGAARALGVSDPVTSPTFSIGHRYRAGALLVCHLDLYRLAGLDQEDPELLADYLGAGRIAFVEWPKDGERELDGARMRIVLSHAGGDRRRIEIEDIDASVTADHEAIDATATADREAIDATATADREAIDAGATADREAIDATATADREDIDAGSTADQGGGPFA